MQHVAVPASNTEAPIGTIIEEWVLHHNHGEHLQFEVFEVCGGLATRLAFGHGSFFYAVPFRARVFVNRFCIGKPPTPKRITTFLARAVPAIPTTPPPSTLATPRGSIFNMHDALAIIEWIDINRYVKDPALVHHTKMCWANIRSNNTHLTSKELEASGRS